MHSKTKLVETARILEQKGFLSLKEGNIAILDREAGRAYVTPSSVRKLTMTEDMVATVDAQTGEQLEGSYKASSETLLLLAALRARMDCTAAIHSHCTYLTAYAFQGRPIDMQNTSNIALFGQIPCIPYGIPGTEDIAKGLPEALQKHNLCLLSNHGVICVGPDMDECAGILELFEDTVKTYVISCSFGSPVSIPDAALQIMRERMGK